MNNRSSKVSRKSSPLARPPKGPAIERLEEVLGRGADLWRDDAELWRDDAELESFLASLREQRRNLLKGRSV
jgi:hypothetical protein